MVHGFIVRIWLLRESKMHRMGILLCALRIRVERQLSVSVARATFAQPNEPLAQKAGLAAVIWLVCETGRLSWAGPKGSEEQTEDLRGTAPHVYSRNCWREIARRRARTGSALCFVMKRKAKSCLIRMYDFGQLNSITCTLQNVMRPPYPTD